MTLADTRTLGRWTVLDVAPDTTVHDNVEVRELQFDSRGAHMTHVTIHGRRGAKIVGTVHEDEHETIYVLRGFVIADIGGRKFQGGPGTVFNIPANTVHGYTPVPIGQVAPEIRLLQTLMGGYDGTVELLAIYNPMPHEAERRRRRQQR